MRDTPYRIFGTLRFVLALIVVISHTLPLAGDTLAAWEPWGVGNIAVMVFFILSGYIIAEALDVFYRNRPGEFLLNRALRIIPPFFVALLLSFVLHIWLNSRGAMVFYDYRSFPEGMFTIRNYIANILSIVVLYGLGHVNLAPDYPFVRNLWAVRVELHFYIVYAFIMWLQYRQNFPWRRFVMPAAFIIITSLAFLAAVTGWSFLNYFYFAPYFVCGVALHRWLSSRTAVSQGMFFVCSGMAAWFFVHYISRGKDAAIIGPLLLLIALSYLIIPLSRVKTTDPVRRIDRWLGDVAYPIYLNHFAVSIVVLNVAVERNMWVFLTCLVSSILFSYMASFLTEPLTVKIRDRIRGIPLH